MLFEISQILSKSAHLPDVIYPVLEIVAAQLDLRPVMLTLLNRQRGEVLIEAAFGLTAQQKRRGRYRMGEGVTGLVAASGQPKIIHKIGESRLFLDRTKRGAPQPERSFICVPIMDGSRVQGTLSAERIYHPDNNLAADARLLSIVAAMVSQAVRLQQTLEEERAKLRAENKRLHHELQNRFRPANIIGNSHEMQIVYDQIAQVSHSAATVLIQGETGSGKELVAQAIHYNSDRADQPFIKVHCAALAEQLIESELFGHVKGAFTGAARDRSGRFELAQGGTLFLDEVGEIPTNIQIKLLRVLQEKEFERVGGTKSIKVNVRLLAATNCNLEELVKRGAFREDLYYRLCVFPIYIPPLRKRKTDIALLADHFLEKYSLRYNKKVRRLSSAVIDMLYAYHWPGNVRELENIMERAVLIAKEEVLHPYLMPPTLQTAESSGTLPQGSLQELVENYERDLLVDALKSSRGNIAAAARLLKTTQRIVGYKIANYRINPRQYVS